MSSIQGSFQQAQLAEAAYSNLSGINSSTASSVLQSRLVNRKPDGSYDFSLTQAAEFAKSYRVIDQYTAPGSSFTTTGFSATLFQNSQTGRYTFALRGTEPGIADLFSADGEGIVGNGVAIHQIVDMYNYWQSLNATGVYAAAKLELAATESNQLARLSALKLNGGPADTVAYDLYVDQLKASGKIIYSRLVGAPQVLNVVTGNSNVLLAGTSLATGSGKLLSSGPLDVVGHSLGGHLAAAFTRLFPLVPATAITVNGAGFPTGLTPGLGGNALANIQNLFAALSGAPAFDSTRINNIHGSGPTFITMNSRFGLVQQGSTQEIFIEKNDPSVTFGHKTTQMTDTLAMYDLFANLDTTLKTANLAAVNTALFNLFKAGSAQTFWHPPFLPQCPAQTGA